MEESWTRPAFGLWNYLVTSLILVITVAIGLYHSFKSRKNVNANEILMASRSMGVLPVTLSVLATYFSTSSLLGVPVETYTYGAQQYLFVLAYLMVIPITIYFYLPVFYEAKVTSTYEYLELRFNPVIRKIASAIYILQTVLMLVIVMYAPALALSQVTGLHIWGSVTVIGSICTLYTTLGGMRAVLWTDAFQIMIMVVSVGTIVINGTLEMGGIGEVWRRSSLGNRTEFFNFNPDPTLRQSFWSATVGGTFTWLCSYGVSQSLVQRYLTTRNENIAKKALWWNLVGLLGMTTLYHLAGLLLYSYYWNCDPLTAGKISARDQLLPLYVMETLGHIPGLPGLFVAGVFSAALSTMSSALNGLAATTLEDFIKPLVYKLSEERATLITKLIPLGYGVLSFALVAIADRFGNIAQATISISGMIGGPLLGLFSLGMLVPWANSMGAGIGLGSGLAISTWLGIGVQISRIQSPKLPISTDECPLNFEYLSAHNSSMLINPSTTSNITESLPTSDSTFALYQVSYLWYTALASLTVLIVGSCISLLTRNANSDAVKEELISPPVRHLMAYIMGRHSASSSQQVLEAKQKAESEGLLMQVLTPDHKIKILET